MILKENKLIPDNWICIEYKNKIVMYASGFTVSLDKEKVDFEQYLKELKGV